MIEAVPDINAENLVVACRAIAGDKSVLPQSADVSGDLTDWTGPCHAMALAVVRPGTTAEVADLVRPCNARDTAMVPQGGLSGGGGGVPTADRMSVLVSLTQMNTIQSIDAGNRRAVAGIGHSKQSVLSKSKEPTQLAVMRSIKKALDPRNIMNPGKLLPPG